MAVPALRFALVVFTLACATSGCELVADFDRAKIPVPPRDAAAAFPDADIDEPRDSGTAGDGATPDGGTGDEDAGR